MTFAFLLLEASAQFVSFMERRRFDQRPYGRRFKVENKVFIFTFFVVFGSLSSVPHNFEMKIFKFETLKQIA